MLQKEVGYLFQNILADFNISDNTYFYTINIQLYTLVIWQYTWYMLRYLVADIEYLDTNIQSKNN